MNAGRLWLCILVIGIGSAPLAAQVSTTLPTEAWVRDYREGLRRELVDGDLVEAGAAYRRVMVSQAPPIYTQRAQYRLANVLSRMGRDSEARAVLDRLHDSLSERSALRGEIGKRLDRLAEDRAERAAYWTEQLEWAVKDHEPGLVKAAAAFLAHQDGADGARKIMAIYEELSPQDALRPLLLGYMAESELPGVVPVLRDALQDADATVRAAAANAVGWIGDAESAEMLVEMLDAADHRVRLQAVEALRRLRHLPAVERLIAMMTTDPDPAVQRSAVQALHCLGTPAALAALDKQAAGETPSDCNCDFSRWYRETRVGPHAPQLAYAPPHQGDEARVPTVGIVVSAMTHHGPTCGDLHQPYARQVRKARTLLQAGFAVHLLVEPEVLSDPAAAVLQEVFSPALPMHPLGEWPGCDLMLMDQLYHLSAGVIESARAYTEQGGRLVVCGAVCGGWCSDEVSWRRLVGVRRPHAHQFRTETNQLNWVHGLSLRAGPDDWAARRRGTAYFHDILDGKIIATFDSPGIWAIKTQSVGEGGVLCLNWDVGLNLQGAQDEDELLGRCLDVILGDDVGAEASRYRMMREARWEHLAEAKSMIEASTVAELSDADREAALVQLFNLYKMENNGAAGAALCTELADGSSFAPVASETFAYMARLPRSVQIALVSQEDFDWWEDVPAWIQGADGVPLWLAGPKELPTVIGFRVAIPASGQGRLDIGLKGAALERLRSVPTGVARVSVEGDSRLVFTFEPGQRYEPWLEMELKMNQWRAEARVQVMTTEVGVAGRQP